MAQIIELPQVGESVVEGTIGKWLKQPGDQVERYEPLVEVITDKVTMELPSPVKGELVRILVQEGETVPMGAAIAEVETGEGSTAPAADAPTATAPTAAPVAAATPSAAPSSAPSPDRIGYFNQSAKPVGPTGGGMVDEAPAPAPVSEKEPARLSPAVRRLAREHGIDLARLTGTGLGGRITRDDVQRFLDSGAAQPAPSPVTPAAAQPAPAAPAGPPEPGADEEYVPLTPVRRMIAEAMVRSVSRIPHAWSAVEVDVTNLVARRSRWRGEFQRREGVDLTYLPLVMQAVAEALRENPTLNATWGEDKIILKKRVNLGIAVAAPQGLVVPVVHDADRLSVSGLAHALQNLTQRARDNRLTLADVQGGTFTLNNTGVLGSVVSQPIINYPQAAIMTTEAIQKRPVVINDAIAIRSMMNLCLSFDHRINDGAEASKFLQSVKRRLEAVEPDASL